MLDNFSETITDSFTGLLDRLQAIAESVSFNMPNIAYGVVPYRTTAVVAAGGNSDIEGTLEANNSELISVIIQSITSQTAALVSALQTYGGTTVNLDTNSLTEAVIQDINRRTRMMGKSPLHI